MSDGIVASTEGFVHEHPYATAGIGISAILLIWFLTSGKPAAAGASAPANSSAYAAQLGADQIAANASTQQASISAQSAVTQAQIAAGVANAATAAGEQTEITASNNQTAQAVAAASAQVGVSANQTLASEFDAIASVLTQYSNNNTAETINNTEAAITYGQQIQADAIGAANSEASNALATDQSQAASFSTLEGQLTGQNNWWLGSTVANFFKRAPAAAGGTGGGASVGSQGGTVAQATQAAAATNSTVNALLTKNAGGVPDQTAALISQLTNKLGNGTSFFAQG